MLIKGDPFIISKCQWQRGKKEFLRQVNESLIKSFRITNCKSKKISKKKLDGMLDDFTIEDFLASVVILMKILGSCDQMIASKFFKSVKKLHETAAERKKAWAYPEFFQDAWELKTDAGKNCECVSGSRVSVFYDHLYFRHHIARNDVIYLGIDSMENWESFQVYAETFLFPKLKRKTNRIFIRPIFQVTLDILKFMKSEKWDKI